MKLVELVLGCYVYDQISEHDSDYCKLLEATNGALDLTNEEHRKELLHWLNKWRCRQFTPTYYEHASGEIYQWYLKFKTEFFSAEKTLSELQWPELIFAGESYVALAERKASFRKKKLEKEKQAVSVGPTGASKILFALRPKALAPWDYEIRKTLGYYDDSKESYISYLQRLQGILTELGVECQEKGFQLSDLPQKLGRPSSSVVKLIDEYHHVTITKGYKLPSSDTIRSWANWL